MKLAFKLMLMTVVLAITSLEGQASATSSIQAPQAHVCIDFESPLVLGARYGTATGLTSGGLAFTASGVAVSVYKFVHPNGATSFNDARIDSASNSPNFGSGQIINTNNINLEFDFSRLPFRVKHLTLEFLDRGGHENLSVNNSRMFIGELSAAPRQLGGVSVSSQTIPHRGSKTGTLKLAGLIKTLRIGGQEFWLDKVCASQ